jgi:hypothetical protein
VQAAETPAALAIRDPASGTRRAFVRFFACQEDLSHQPFLVVGAMAGG